MKPAINSLFLIFIPICAFSQTIFEENAPVEKRIYTTRPIPSNTINLDGIMDEPEWETVEWTTDFVENQPDQNTAPHQQSKFKILFDEKYLYVGFRCLDSAPDSIVKRMSRRDEFPGDWIEINIDSYHDLRTAFSFTFSVSGVRGDEFVSNNGNNWDDSWNPIWNGKSNVDEEGWSAEIKIPFSQLRYGKQERPVWGIQVTRRIFRMEERSQWQFIPQNAGGFVSEFGELHGLRNLPDNRGVEIAPYIVASAERFEKEEGNPFADGSINKLTVGLDGKFSVTRDLILDYTINPDFGQVEADPGAVRLDGYQVFFSERRPFFVESRNLFDYGLTESAAGGDYDSDLLFYSRRIGGAPHEYPSLGNNEYASVPQATSILGAAKFSGKTSKGTSIGILESVTQREMAEIDFNGQRREQLVEPLSNYFVGRVMQDFDEGNTILGGVFTAVNREKGIDWLHRNAYSGGLDVQHFWKDRTYSVTGKLMYSRVNGTPESIAETQRGFVHNFQRPNAEHLEVDETRTSLTGTGGTLKLSKFGGKQDKIGGVFKFETGTTWRSPEFEINDMGFLLAADEINHFTWVGYHIQKPNKYMRRWSLNYNHWKRWDFGGQFLNSLFNMNGHISFLNNWNFGTGFNYNPYDVSNNRLRGGSSLRMPSGWGNWAYLNTDSRRDVSFWLNTWFFQGQNNQSNGRNYSGGVTLQPMNALQVRLNVSYFTGYRQQDQYVDIVDFNGESRYITSQVNNKDLSFTARVNYNISPNLTIQYYGQPYIFRALYKNYSRVTDPLNKKISERFYVFGDDELAYSDGTYSVDENGDGLTDYSFGEPDFNYVQFRSNMVLRWEYVPGSEFYIVWSQGAFPDAYDDLSTPLGSSLFNNVFQDRGRNIFLMKLTYRFVK